MLAVKKGFSVAGMVVVSVEGAEGGEAASACPEVVLVGFFEQAVIRMMLEKTITKRHADMMAPDW